MVPVGIAVTKRHSSHSYRSIVDLYTSVCDTGTQDYLAKIQYYARPQG